MLRKNTGYLNCTNYTQVIFETKYDILHGWGIMYNKQSKYVHALEILFQCSFVICDTGQWDLKIRYSCQLISQEIHQFFHTSHLTADGRKFSADIGTRYATKNLRFAVS